MNFFLFFQNFKICFCTVKNFKKKYIYCRSQINPVLVNTGTFLVYRYCRKMSYYSSLERASVIQKLTILKHKNSLVLFNTHVLVSGTCTHSPNFFPVFKTGPGEGKQTFLFCFLAFYK